MSGIKFEPGQIVATPGALEAFRASGDDPLAYLVRHIAGDWAWGERPISANLTRIIHIFEDNKSLLCYKHVD